MCSLCGDECESIIQALFLCSKVANVWEQSECKVCINEAPKTSFTHLFAWLREKLDKPDLLCRMSSMWAIWAF